jgi:hypothetical protein
LAFYLSTYFDEDYLAIFDTPKKIDTVKDMMKKLFKKQLSNTDIYYRICILRFKLTMKRDLRKWEKSGRRSSTPHIVKQEVIKGYSQKYHIATLVETGTYLGDMVDAMKKDFKKIFSIELDVRLFKWSNKRFKRSGHIAIIQGDSSEELKKLMSNLTEPAIFWLDGHYSDGITAKGDKDTPICEELDCILNSEIKGHIIIIDDARNFGSDSAYPTIQELKNIVFSISPNAEIVIKDDIIRIIPINSVS